MTESPYVGLRPYSDREASIFFGRERERRIVASNLVASRLTLLYGPSGVGKSSILNAGVVPDLRARAELEADDGRPAYAVAVFNAWRDEPVAGLVQTLAAGSPADGTPLAEALRSWTETAGTDLLLVLDQFEEYFLYHGGRGGQDRFAREFPDAVNDPTLRVNFLVSFREDALASLDLFKGRIPRLFGNYLRIGYLDAAGARRAIRGPIDEHNKAHPEARVGIEDALVAAVLEQVQAGRVVVGQAGAGTVETPGAGPSPTAIETSHLQIVMARLWAEEAAAGSSMLRAATLDQLGGAAEIVRSHLDRELSTLSEEEQDLTAAALEHLVTPSGTKIAHSAPDLAVLAEADEAALAAVLGRLSSGASRILRSVEPAPGRADERYEIFHDVLAPAVLDWRARHVQRKEAAAAEVELRRQREEAEERARAARRKAVYVSVFSLVAAALIVTVVLLRNAQHQRELTRSRQQAAEAQSFLTVDPVRSVRGALAALDTARTPEAETALRQAVAAVSVRSVLTGHSDWVQTIAFDPAGTRVVTSSNDRTARIWDVASGQPRAELKGHTHWVVGAAFDPGGRTVLTAGADGTARIWDAATGAELRVLAPPLEGRMPIVTARFDPAGTTVVTAGNDGIARLWDAGSGRLVHELRGHSGLVTSVRFDATGRRLVSAGSDGTVRVWGVAAGTELARFDRHRGRVTGAVFSPDGQLVGTAGSDRMAYVWRWHAGDAVALSEHTAGVDGIEFDGGGGHVVTAGDTVARVWDVTTGRVIARLRGHAGALTAAMFTPDGLRVLTSAQDGSARLWDVATAATRVELRGHPEIVWNLALSPDERLVATAGSDGTARLWALPEQLTLVHPAPVETAAFSPDGRAVVTTDVGNARVWDSMTGAQEAVLPGHDGSTSASFSRDGRLVVTVDELRARVWDRGAPARPVAETAEVRRGLARFLPASDGVVVSDEDGTLYRWDWRTGAPLRRLTGYRGPHQVTDLDLSADGTRALTAWSDRVARIWDLGTGRELVTLRGHDGIVYSARFSPDARRAVTSSADGSARIWDAATGKQVRSLETDRGLRTAAFSPDGGRVLAGAVDGSVRVWNAATGRTVSVLPRHTTTVNAAAFSPDGNRILSAGDDRTAVLAACPTCARLAEVRAQAEDLEARIPVRAERTASGWALVSGDCYNAATPYARIVDCQSPHESEVFAVIEHPAGYDVPFDGDRVRADAQEQCEGRPFSNYVGAPSAGSRWSVSVWSPNEASWNAGDRRIVCVLSAAGGSKGSARGSAK